MVQKLPMSPSQSSRLPGTMSTNRVGKALENFGFVFKRYGSRGHRLLERENDGHTIALSERNTPKQELRRYLRNANIAVSDFLEVYNSF